MEQINQIKKVRDSNFELLRCIAMFMIMCCHFKAHGLRFPETEMTQMEAFLQSFGNWTGSISNFIFMLISGFFLSSTTFTWKKEFKIYSQYWFYSAIFGIYLLINHCVINPQQFYDAALNPQNYPDGFTEKVMNFKYLASSCMPFLTNQNWYACGYLIFFLFTPFLNKLLQNLEQKDHLKLCFILLGIGGVLQIIPVQKAFEPDYLVDFATFYFVANYIKKYDPKIFSNFKVNLLISLMFIVIFVGWSNAIWYAAQKIDFVKDHFNQLYGLSTNKFMKEIAAIFIFCTFRKLSIKPSRFINTLGGCTFGLYLIHNNRTFKHYMWFELFKSQSFIDSPYLPLIIIGIVLMLFNIGCIVELLRQQLFLVLDKLLIKKIRR